MNKSTIVAVIIAIAVLLAVGNAQTGNQGQIGRYQLFTGEHKIVGNNTSLIEKEIMRIDTVTGETRAWVNGQAKNGTIVSFWGSPIEPAQ